MHAASKPVAPPVRYIHTRLLRYHPCVVELRWSRAVHSCDVCPYRSVAGGGPPATPPPGRTAAGPVVRCGAVHYGVCSPVKAAAAAAAPVNGRSAAGVLAGRSTSPPPPPLPAKRRINIPIVVQQKQQQLQQPQVNRLGWRHPAAAGTPARFYSDWVNAPLPPEAKDILKI